MDGLSSWMVIPAAFALDILLGDPQRFPHPVRWMGKAISTSEPWFRKIPAWKVPEISRDDPEAAKILGAGSCELSGDSPVGSGNFIWPSDLHYLSGYDYLPQANHAGVDIAVDPGSPVYAVDSGVVVYAGWNSWGYGNMVVMNHGNDWQTLYANLTDLYVACGQTIWQGGVIGAIHPSSSIPTQNTNLPAGTTPAPTDIFQHFEMMFEGKLVNPLDYLP